MKFAKGLIMVVVVCAFGSYALNAAFGTPELKGIIHDFLILMACFGASYVFSSW